MLYQSSSRKGAVGCAASPMGCSKELCSRFAGGGDEGWKEGGNLDEL